MEKQVRLYILQVLSNQLQKKSKVHHAGEQQNTPGFAVLSSNFPASNSLWFTPYRSLYTFSDHIPQENLTQFLNIKLS